MLFMIGLCCCSAQCATESCGAQQSWLERSLATKQRKDAVPASSAATAALALKELDVFVEQPAVAGPLLPFQVELQVLRSGSHLRRSQFAVDDFDPQLSFATAEHDVVRVPITDCLACNNKEEARMAVYCELDAKIQKGFLQFLISKPKIQCLVE